MKTYVALMFAKPEDISTYGKEVAAAIKSVAGSRMIYVEGGAHMVAIGFATNVEEAIIRSTFAKLGRSEQRTWVLPLDSAVHVDQALMDWARKQVPESPFSI
ncbi:hypothetical protein EDC26_10496 [Paralcaligenes ureilyticus]|uniref:Uncharacterized protein n=2 Tax=Paralcaligenes ureilyticus TaxID=627131 RepID=A0A4R3M7C8_9BURK|nr:hypothetical protein EDC26_10496 [Paralcaligenes ureilyticus]